MSSPRQLPITAERSIKILPVAFDSFGVKAMCTRITTPDLTLVIDPGVSAQTEHFPLPENIRQQLLTRYAQEVNNATADAPVLIITHYHIDHFFFHREPAIYAGKIIFAKSLDDLPKKQVETAERFFPMIDGLPKEIIWADGRRFKFKKTEIRFSPAIWHGRAEAEPGRVIMTEVSRGREKVLISSDIAGPADEKTTQLILATAPQVAILDGYPTFLLPTPSTEPNFLKSIINLCQILSLPSLHTLVIDHHLARDYRYPALIKPVYQLAAKMKKKFGTAAEIIGRKSLVLQGLGEYGTTRWQRWYPLDLENLRLGIQNAINQKKLSADWLKKFDWLAETILK